jgi:hypothetical protein
MRRRLWALLAVVAALVIVAAIPAAAGGAGKTILHSQTLVGVPAAFTGTQAPIRGVNGGGLPWVVAFGRVELSQGGWVDVKVKGLVIDPAAASANAGSNPSPTFRVLVSCLTSAGAISNTLSDPFPATTGLGAGNAAAELQLAIPSPCIAPIVFVTSAGGAWFASTGG